MIDFLGKKIIALTISSILVASSLFLIFTQGLNWGIDFKGGTLMHLKFEKKVDQSIVRKTLDNLGVSPSVQGVKGKPNEVLIRTKYLYDDKKDGITKDQVKSALEKVLGFKIVSVMKATDIGPIVGRQLRAKALKALILSVIGMLIYITWRFEFKFGLGAVIALIHDCLITIGIFVLLRKQIDITMLAALLTIVGYSLNDTIVICDRVRENLRLLRTKGKSFQEIFNVSINESLTRTINTSLTTFIPVLILFTLGSGPIANFALALMIGVIVGTYSSMYIVAPFTVAWNSWEKSHEKVGSKR
jgi:preprotein translocase subunit SecF